MNIDGSCFSGLYRSKEIPSLEDYRKTLQDYRKIIGRHYRKVLLQCAPSTASAFCTSFRFHQHTKNTVAYRQHLSR